ncbi:thiamine-binding protein [Gordonia sp. NPDC003376]
MIVAFSLSPSGGDAVADDGGMSEAVAEAVRVVRASGLPHQTTAMFTYVEGEWDEVMAVVKAAADAVAARAPRVGLVLKADIRPGHTDELTGKVARVNAHLGQPEGPRQPGTSD